MLWGFFVGGRTGSDPRSGKKSWILVPVERLNEVVPIILENLDTYAPYIETQGMTHG